MSEVKSVFFSSCVGCDLPFVKVNLETGEETPFASEYPICMRCMQRGAKEPEWWKETKNKIYELTNNRNNTETGSIPKPEKV